MDQDEFIPHQFVSKFVAPGVVAAVDLMTAACWRPTPRLRTAWT